MEASWWERLREKLGLVQIGRAMLSKLSIPFSLMDGAVFHPWVGKIPWRRKWQPTPVFLPGESHRQSRLVDYSL